MFLILKLILIISINKTYAYIRTQDTETTLLPTLYPADAKEILLTLKVFGKLIQLSLRRNDHIVLPAFVVWKYNAKSVAEKLSELRALDPCFYLHEDHVSFAAINFCQEHGLEGLVFVENDILEVRPLRNVFAPLSFIDDFCVREQMNLSFGKLHLIKRSLHYFAGSDHHNLHKIRLKRRNVDEIPKKQERYTIELAVFVDERATHSLQLFLGLHNTVKLKNMMYEFVNRIQTFFHHPNLGVSIDISLVWWEFMEVNPWTLLLWNGDSDPMLKSVCNYAKTRNVPNDDNPRHWDIFLFLTGLNITVPVPTKSKPRHPLLTRTSRTWIPRISIGEDPIPIPDESSDLKYRIPGIAYINGTCNPEMACAIAQVELYERHYFGTKTAINAAHQIGRLLGLPYDTERKSRTYIMSSEPWNYDSEITWSSRSRKAIKEVLQDKSCLREDKRLRDFDDPNLWTYVFDNSPYPDLPGRKWTAKAQCELLLRDQNANVVTLHDICQNLQCETPHTNKSYFVGRALNGTYCSYRKECRSGECVPVIEPPYKFKYCERDKWSEWKEDSCNSSCLVNSKGVLIKRRFCKHRIHRTANCTGPYYDVVMCDDSLFCAKKHKTVLDFATTKCAKFSEMARDANLTVGLLRMGWQLSHVVEKPWIACTVACSYNASVAYQPREEMLTFGMNPYFPDGTWCGEKDGQNYYCRRHYCLPESYSFEE